MRLVAFLSVILMLIAVAAMRIIAANSPLPPVKEQPLYRRDVLRLHDVVAEHDIKSITI